MASQKQRSTTKPSNIMHSRCKYQSRLFLFRWLSQCCTHCFGWIFSWTFSYVHFFWLCASQYEWGHGRNHTRPPCGTCERCGTYMVGMEHGHLARPVAAMARMGARSPNCKPVGKCKRLVHPSRCQQCHPPRLDAAYRVQIEMDRLGPCSPICKPLGESNCLVNLSRSASCHQHWQKCKMATAQGRGQRY